MLTQLLTYAVWEWCIFAAVTFAAARRFGGGGMLLGHILVAVFVSASDLYWIQSEMTKPEWSGSPDQDFVFHIGLFIRVLLVNTVLLPVGCLGLFLRPKQPAVAMPVNTSN